MTDPQMELVQIIAIWVSEELGIMAMKSCGDFLSLSVKFVRVKIIVIIIIIIIIILTCLIDQIATNLPLTIASEMYCTSLSTLQCSFFRRETFLPIF